MIYGIMCYHFPAAHADIVCLSLRRSRDLCRITMWESPPCCGGVTREGGGLTPWDIYDFDPFKITRLENK